MVNSSQTFPPVVPPHLRYKYSYKTSMICFCLVEGDNQEFPKYLRLTPPRRGDYGKRVWKMLQDENQPHEVFTGLVPTKRQRFYFGDVEINVEKSLVLVYVSPDEQRLEIVLFPNYYPPKRGKTRTVNHLLNQFGK